MNRLFSCISTDFDNIANFVLVRSLTEPAPYMGHPAYGAGSVTDGRWWHILSMVIRDVIFRKMKNQNQTDTSEMATTETKYQTDFSCRKIPIFNQILTRAFSKCRYNAKKIPRNLGQKCQIPIWFWYFLGIPNFWLPIYITSGDTAPVITECHPGRPWQIERTFNLKSSSIMKKITARYNPGTAFFCYPCKTAYLLGP